MYCLPCPINLINSNTEKYFSLHKITRNTTSELRGQVEEKYKHVEDSAFKRNFLSRISGTLEEKIEAAMLSNYVSGNNNIKPS